MGISQGFAVAHEDDRKAYNNLGELVLSYDLNGKVMDVNNATELIIGYSRDEALGMDIRALMGQESWDLIREQIVDQMDGSPRHLEVTALAKEGHHVKLAVTRRLLFEGGRPIAVQDSCRPVAAPASSAELPSELVEQQAHLS